MRRTSRGIFLVALLVVAIAAFLLLARRGRNPEPPPTPPRLVARFLDVGQGDSELIQLPDGESVLIDSGDRGAPTVELLRGYGVEKINLIIATHPHSDHIGEMRQVMGAFKVDEFWDSGFNHPTRTYSDMLEEIRGRGIRFAMPKRGFTRLIGDVLIEVLNPPREPLDDQPNNASLVVRMTYGETRLLFPGDAERRAWDDMLAVEEDRLRADLLKAAHHGSSNGTFEQVMEAVRPAIFTISCGRGNEYHHPHPRVVRLLEENGGNIAVHRTDLEGTIVAISDGNRIDVSVERPVAENMLYLTGDEVAGKLASGSASESGSRRTRARSAR